LTLTLKNQPDLDRALVSRLVESFAKLRKCAEWRLVAPGAEGISGGVYSIEATFNVQAETWHPHLHTIIEAPLKLPKEWIHALRAKWLAITGDSFVLHLKKVGAQSERRWGRRRHRTVRGVLARRRKAVSELVKYVTKSAAFASSPERVAEFLDAFAGVRRIQAFGSFLGVGETPEREPGEDSAFVPGCRCGGCTAVDFREVGYVHVSRTVEGKNGERQLSLFGESPPCLEEFRDEDWFTSSEVRIREQRRFVLGDLYSVMTPVGQCLLPMEL